MGRNALFFGCEKDGAGRWTGLYLFGIIKKKRGLLERKLRFISILFDLPICNVSIIGSFYLLQSRGK
jgi:hypothetical protein